LVEHPEFNQYNILMNLPAPREAVIAVLSQIPGTLITTNSQLRNMVFVEHMHGISIPFGRSQPFIYYKMKADDDQDFLHLHNQITKELGWEDIGFLMDSPGPGPHVAELRRQGVEIFKVVVLAPYEENGECVFDESFKGHLNF
jgi:hypothetical protein